MDFKKWAVIIPLFFPGYLEAHGLFTFAWAEGDLICTDSYFSRNSKARGARISMVDQAGAVLASGQTDTGGGFCFKRPERPQQLVFVVEAQGGHRGEFTLPAEGPPPADEARTDPGLREIVGGLGWLAGLAGLGFWWAARRERGRLQRTP